MIYRTVIFSALFLLTTGLTAFGIMLSLNLIKRFKDSVGQALVYQQIFIYAFLIYVIWGNILSMEFFADFKFNKEVYKIISFFIPFLGMPFLILSWYMLIKFFFNFAGKSIYREFSIGYFLFFTFSLLVITYLVRSNNINLTDTPEKFVTRFIVLLNLSIHAVFFILVLIFVSVERTRKYGLTTRYWIYLYFAGTVFYSSGFWFIHAVPFFVKPLIILTAFGINTCLPLILDLKIVLSQTLSAEESLTFEKFCLKFEISKREAEIIQEICSGKSNQEIADRLFITLQTVKDHAHRIYTKTGAKSRVQLTNLVRGIIKK